MFRIEGTIFEEECGLDVFLRSMAAPKRLLISRVVDTIEADVYLMALVPHASSLESLRVNAATSDTLRDHFEGYKSMPDFRLLCDAASNLQWSNWL